MIDLTDAPMWLIWSVAISATATLLSAIYLLRRSRSSRGAGVALLVVSILFHAALILGLPMLVQLGGGLVATTELDVDQPPGELKMSLSMFETLDLTDQSAAAVERVDTALPLGPLPIDTMGDLTTIEDPTPPTNSDRLRDWTPGSTGTPTPGLAQSLASDFEDALDDQTSQQLDHWLDETEPDEKIDQPLDTRNETPVDQSAKASIVEATPSTIQSFNKSFRSTQTPTTKPATASDALPAASKQTVAAKQTVIGELADDFAARKGSAKQIALDRTGGDADTEAAVMAALKFLSQTQKDDGGWDPDASNAGRERSPLGFRRGGAGSKAETAITGLSLLAMMGSGHTHQEGEHADSVYRGLSRLMSLQKPNGSLAGDASIYSATYCHGMASLALAEAAAMTGDPSAIDATNRAVNYTESIQHPSTGGWRYTKGDPGDLSQLGWQAMVLDGAHRAGIAVQPSSVRGIERFLNTVRAGRSGGLAAYRNGELPSRTMTAESLATHLLLGLPVTDEAVAEAERYLLADLPGRGVDNYYYWYYATVALHQLQDDAWLRWNDALKRRLLMTQQADGSWPADTLWGGYGGTVYTTSMATLCLETYYRHVVREEAKMARTSSLRR